MIPRRASSRAARRLLAAAIAIALATPIGGARAPAAAADDELPRRSLANAEQLLKEGRIEQALREFDQIATAYPASGVADDALFRLGSHYYPADHVEDVGRAGRDAVAKARELFTRITSKYPSEDMAPRALVKLGLLALEPANPRRSLDEAYASFSSAVNIYPTSDVVDVALFGAGYADFAAGRFDKSITSFEQVAERFSRGPVAPAARFQMGLAQARLGAHVRALEEFQAVRTLDPKGPLAARALDRLTQIYKLKILPGVGGRALFSHDPAYSPALDPNTVRGDISLAVGPDNVLHVLDARAGTLLRLGHDGKLASTGQPMPGAVSLSVDDAGLELAAAGDRLRAGVDIVIPTRVEAGGPPRPLEGIAAVVRVGTTEAALLDTDRNEVLQYNGDPAHLGLLYRDPAGRARLTGLAAGPDGRLYTIDKRARAVVEIAPASSGGGYKSLPLSEPARQALQEPTALAADDLGTLYVLDRRARAIHVITTEGRLLESLVAQQGTASDFSYASALAVGPRAEIYVYDAKRKTILRFW